MAEQEENEVQTVLGERGDAMRVRHNSPERFYSVQWPTVSYCFARVPADSGVSDVRVEFTAADQGWGNTGHSHMGVGIVQPEPAELVAQWTAFAMCKHPRLGALAPARVLPHDLMRNVWARLVGDLPYTRLVTWRGLPAVTHEERHESYQLSQLPIADAVRQLRPGDEVHLVAASAPYPGFECRCKRGSVAIHFTALPPVPDPVSDLESEPKDDEEDEDEDDDDQIAWEERDPRPQPQQPQPQPQRLDVLEVDGPVSPEPSASCCGCIPVPAVFRGSRGYRQMA